MLLKIYTQITSVYSEIFERSFLSVWARPRWPVSYPSGMNMFEKIIMRTSCIILCLFALLWVGFGFLPSQALCDASEFPSLRIGAVQKKQRSESHAVFFTQAAISGNYAVR